MPYQEEVQKPYLHMPCLHMPYLHMPHLHMPHLHMPYLHMPYLHMPYLSSKKKHKPPKAHLTPFEGQDWVLAGASDGADVPLNAEQSMGMGMHMLSPPMYMLMYMLRGPCICSGAHVYAQGPLNAEQSNMRMYMSVYGVPRQGSIPRPHAHPRSHPHSSPR